MLIGPDIEQVTRAPKVGASEHPQEQIEAEKPQAATEEAPDPDHPQDELQHTDLPPH